jgi:hypothetical protein
MDSALWPPTTPELLRHAAGRLLSERDADLVAERLRAALGVDQYLRLDAEDLMCARDAARLDPTAFDRLALTLAMVVGRQLLHEYPSSSILWDAACEELHDVLGGFGFVQPVGVAWNRGGDGDRTIVVEVFETVSTQPDDRRFTLRWGIVLPAVAFCRHEGAHQLSCCAIAGGMGSVRKPHGDHAFVVTLGTLLELLSGAPGRAGCRVVGREGFRARVHRLASFCDRVVERDRLVELVVGHPWRSGIGIAERLRNAGPGELGELLA